MTFFTTTSDIGTEYRPGATQCLLIGGCTVSFGIGADEFVDALPQVALDDGGGGL